MSCTSLDSLRAQTVCIFTLFICLPCEIHIFSLFIAKENSTKTCLKKIKDVTTRKLLIISHKNYLKESNFCRKYFCSKNLVSRELVFQEIVNLRYFAVINFCDFSKVSSKKLFLNSPKYKKNVQSMFNLLSTSLSQ